MKKATILAIAAMISLQAAAQDTLSLAECRIMAIQHNKGLESARVNVEKSGADEQTMRSYFLPNIKLNAGGCVNTLSNSFSMPGATLPIYSFDTDLGQFVPKTTFDLEGNPMLSQYAEFPGLSVKSNFHTMFNAGLSLTQPIYMGGKIGTGYNMAKLGRKMVIENLHLSENEIIVQVDEAYAMAVKAREMLGVAKAYEAMLIELQNNVESAIRNGMRTRNDLLKVQVRLNQARLSITKAENAINLARMNLCRIIGSPLDRNIIVETVSPDMDALMRAMNTGADSTLVRNRPEYAMLMQNTELAKLQIKLTRAEYLPQLMAFANVGYINGGNISIDASSSLAGTQNLVSKNIFNKVNASVGITLSIPILDFGERSGKLRSAKASYRIAEIEREDNIDKMNLELAQANNALSEQISALQISTISVEQAEENLRMSKSAFEQGVETLSDYLEAQMLWQSAKADEINARVMLMVAITKWQKAAGQL